MQYTNFMTSSVSVFDDASGSYHAVLGPGYPSVSPAKYKLAGHERSEGSSIGRYDGRDEG